MTERTDTREAGMRGPDLVERTAQIAAHRACCGIEHDPTQGKLHGYCVVCGVPWPCEYAGKPPAAHAALREENERLLALGNGLQDENVRLRADLDAAMGALREVNESGFYGQWLKKHAAILAKAKERK